MVFGAIVGTTAALGLLVSIFGDRYESSPEEVQDACDELINIQQNTLSAIADEIGQNVVIVNNASNGYVDMSNMNAYVPAVEESIANLTGMLDKQAQIIEEYNSGSLVEKMIGTGTMAILNVTEGVLKFGEDILDCGANILAGVGTFCGFDTEEIELWAAKDHVGDAFDNAFENGAFSWVEKYSIYSHESAAAELLKGIGTAVPYIALAATGVGLVAEAGIAGAAGFGRGSTNYQQQHLVYDANGEALFDDTYSTGSMMWEGTKQGAIDAVLTVGMDKGFKALGKGISKLKAGKAAGEAGEKLLTEGTEAAVQKATTEGAEKALQKATTEGAEKAAQKVATEGTEKAAQKLATEGAEKAAQKATTEGAEKAAQKVATEGTEKAAQKLATESTEKAAQKVATEGTESAAQKVATESTEKAAQKVATESTEKTAQKVATQSTEKTAQKVVTEGTESAAQKVVSKTDDAVLSETKQELLKKMKNGEITRDEMLDGVRKAANPEAALTKDKATLLEKFKSGEITRDEMIQGIQKSAGNAPAENIVKNATSQADDLLRVTSKTDDAVLSETKQELLKKMKNGEITRDEMLDGVRKAANPEAALTKDKATLLEKFKSGEITRDEMIQGIQKSAGNAPAENIVKNATSQADDLLRVTSKTDDAVLSETKQELLKKMKNGEITRDEMLDGVRKAANPEAALTKDKATLLEKFKSGEITRDEMIQGIQKSAGNAPAENIVKNATSQADDLLRVTSKTEQKIVKEGSETVGKKIATEADDIGKNAFERYAEKMGSGESAKYENLIRNSNKVSAETAEQMAKKASAEAAEKTVQKVATESAEKAVQKVATESAEKAVQKVATESAETTAQKVATESAEKAVQKVATEGAEKAAQKVATESAEKTVQKAATEGAEKAAQSGSKWQSPLQAQTPAAKVTKAYDDLVSNIKNTANSAKEKVNDVISNLKSSAGKTAADAGPRLGDNTISSKVTRAYDNAAAGLKNVGQKAGTAAKKVATDTATFVKENPKSALIGGGLIAAEKTIGNMKTSYIPTDYASGEIKNFAATGNGETRIVIDAVDDITIPSTSPEQFASTDSTGSTGSTGSGYSGGTYTPSSPDLKPTSGNTTTPGQNSDTSTTEKTPEKTTDNEKNNNPSKNPDDANKPTTDDNKTPDDNKTTNPTPAPSKDESSVVSNPPSSNNNQSTSGVNHGGTTTNNNSGNNNWNSNSKTDSNNETTSELEPELEPELPIEDSELIEEPDEEESVYTIPSNLSGVSETKKSSSGSGVLPVLGGLGAAAAVGVGAKMYLDNKKNNENGEDEDSDGEFDEYSNDEFTDPAENNDLLADEWNGEDTEFNYENPSGSSIVEPDDDDLGEM